MVNFMRNSEVDPRLIRRRVSLAKTQTFFFIIISIPFRCPQDIDFSPQVCNLLTRGLQSPGYHFLSVIQRRKERCKRKGFLLRQFCLHSERTDSSGSSPNTPPSAPDPAPVPGRRRRAGPLWLKEADEDQQHTARRAKVRGVDKKKEQGTAVK